MVGFAQQIGLFKKKYEARMRVVGREAVQEVVSRAQQVRAEGGRMRVKTGFLRASIHAALHAMPSGKSTNKEQAIYPVGSQVDGEPVSVVLLKWDPNEEVPLYIGWTANYARHREAHDGFLRGAIENWDVIVEQAARKAKAQIG